MGCLWATTWRIIKLWPTQWGKESNPLAHLQHRLRLRRRPPAGEPKSLRTELSQQTCCKQIQVNVVIKTRLQVKGQLLWNVNFNCSCQAFCANKGRRLEGSPIRRTSLCKEGVCVCVWGTPFLTKCQLCSEMTMGNKVKCVPGQISCSDESKWEWSVIHPASRFFSGQLSGHWIIPLIYICQQQEIKVKGSMHHVPQRKRKESEQDQ